MIRDTRSEMKEYMSTSTIANSTTSAEPLNTSVASSMISSTDSRHMLDDNVIHRYTYRRQNKLYIQSPFQLINISHSQPNGIERTR